MERAATPDEDKMLRGTVGKILYSPPCQKINFTVWKWPINGNGYRRVAEKLALTGPETRIRFHLNPDKPNFAFYDAPNNIFTFGRADFGLKAEDGKLATEQGMILHEATHAVLDAIDTNGVLNRWHSEVTAYLAEAFFRLFDSAQSSMPVTQRYPLDKPTHVAAMTIASAARRTGDCPLLETRHVLSLINALRATPTYEKDIKNPQPVGNNGI